MGGTGFEVHSKVRPWNGTFADVDRAARALAGALRARGVGPGDVVVVQLPNWVEAGITFWAAAYLGAVVVPIVHFYGPKEVEYILRVTCARRGGDRRPVRAQRLPGDLFGAARAAHRARCGWWSATRPSETLPSGSHAVRRRCSTPSPSPIRPASTPTPRRSSASPRAPRATPRASSTRTAPSAARPASSTRCSPRGGPPQITGAPVGPLHRDAQRVPVPLLRERPVHLVDVWDPAEVLRLMSDEGSGSPGAPRTS